MVVLLTVALLTTLDVLRQRELFRQQVEHQGILLSGTLNDVLGNALYFNNIERLRHLVDAVRANPEIRELTVFAVDGRILVDASGAKYPVGHVDPQLLQLVRRAPTAQVRVGDGPPEVIMGIVGGSGIVGGIHFAFDTAHLEAEIAATIRQHLWQAALALALGVGLALYLARRLVDPLRRLTAATRRIAAGDFSAPIEAQRPDEIGELAVAMQAMSEQLRRSERQRAERQTEVLRSANRRLQDEIAERRRAETEREALITHLEAKTAEMEQFNHTVSHDLKSPLVTIRGFLQEIHRNLPQDSGALIEGDMQRVFTATDHMKKLLDDLVEVSRAGRLGRPPQAIDLAVLAREAVELVTGPRDGAMPEVSISEELPRVFGDRDRLLWALQNLVENAVKFGRGAGPPRIHIGARREGNETVIFVEDDGIGIDPAHREKVFRIFTQLNPTDPGTGIGLALVKRVVETHNGRIWVESEGFGRGARFCFTLGRPKPREAGSRSMP